MNNLGEYWGKYQGWEIYKYYDKDIKAHSKRGKDYIFAQPNDNGWQLWRDGYVIGMASNGGNIFEFDPEIPTKERLKVKLQLQPVEEENTLPVTSEIDTDKILENAMKRSIEDLVGYKFSE